MFCADPANIKMFVLDEADEMLSRGFKDQIYDVFRFMPSEIQVIPPFQIFGYWWFRMFRIMQALFYFRINNYDYKQFRSQAGPTSHSHTHKCMHGHTHQLTEII